MERTGCGIVVPAWGDAGSCSGSPESDGIGAPFLPTGQVDISKWGLVLPPAKGRWHPCLAQLAFVWSGAVLGSDPCAAVRVDSDVPRARHSLRHGRDHGKLCCEALV